jgi:hypothetical protein
MNSASTDCDTGSVTADSPGEPQIPGEVPGEVGGDSSVEGRLLSSPAGRRHAFMRRQMQRPIKIIETTPMNPVTMPATTDKTMGAAQGGGGFRFQG